MIIPSLISLLQLVVHRRYLPAFLCQLLGLILLLNTNSAFATDCDMRLNEAELDYGRLFRGELSTGRHAQLIPLGKRKLTLTVLCQSPTNIGLRFDASPAGTDSFRFAENGIFKIVLNNAHVDGAPVFLARPQTTASAGTIAQLVPNQPILTISNGKVAVGKSFTVDIEIDTYIDNETSKLRDETILEGSGTFTFIRDEG